MWFAVRGFWKQTIKILSAADKVDDLQAVALRQVGFGPVIAGYDAAVQFNSDAIGFHSEFIDQTAESERRSKVAGFAVDLQFHIVWIFAVRTRRPSLRRLLRFDFAQVEFAGSSAT